MTLILLLIITLISIGVIVFGKFFLREYKLTLYLIPYLYFVPLTSIADGYYRALKQFKKAFLIYLLVFTVSIPISLLLIKKFQLLGALISQNVIFFFLAVCLFLSIRSIRIEFSPTAVKEILKYSFIIGLSGIVYFMYGKADILILRHLNYTVEIGYYEVVNKFFLIAIVPFTVLGQVLGPNITSHFAKKRYSIVKSKFIKHFLASAGLGIAVTLMMLVCTPLVIEKFFPEYFIADTLIIFRWLLIILPLRIIASTISQGHVIATGNADLSLWALTPAGLGNVILDFLFIKKHGFIGVVYSTLICYCFAIVSLILMYYWRLNFLTSKQPG